MKIAVSIPDDVFADVEALAERTNRSRSRLYTDALRSYLAHEAQDAITEAYNRLADEGLLELDPFVAEASDAILRRSEW